MKVLITDGENRSALAVTRSLGRRGCDVFVSGSATGNLSASSKYCSKAVATPDPMSNGNNYAQAIADIVLAEKIDVVFPVTEQSIYCLNKSRAMFDEMTILACAPSGKMEAVSNKYKLFRLAEKLGVPIPHTLYVDGVEDFTTKNGLIRSFPVVVKPAFSKIQDEDRIISTGVMYAADHHELKRLYETKPALRYPSMIQEMITGEGTGLFTLFDQEHLALFSHQRILEKPPSGGVSVICKSVPLDQEMVAAAQKLLAAVDWKGVAMVEFKRDMRDGTAKLMEINGRFWGSIQLAIASGVDFPSLCLEYYMGRKPATLKSNYRIGQRLKWYLGILDHLIIRVRKGPRRQFITQSVPSLVQVMGELVRFGDSHTSYDVYDADDRGPFFTEFGTYMRNVLGLKG